MRTALRKRLLQAWALLALSIPAFATAVVPQVVYTVNLGDTKNGHDIIDTVLVEFGPGSVVQFSKKGTMVANGQTVFSSDDFGQTQAAILGLEAPSFQCDCASAAALSPDFNWHLIFAMNNAAALAAEGNVISTLYPPAHENPTIAALQSWYATDDATALATLQTFLTDASSALFNIPGPFTVIEFSPGLPIGNGRAGVPEPGTLVLAGVGAIAIWVGRRRVRR